MRVERPGLTRALEILREGDTLVVWKLDRRKRKLTAVCSHQTRIGNLDAHLI
ncbi:recombinase family protein [Escherichia coli]|uniref:recombinase family protein n=1 Tax=Escherichia coli TaxID=562 RepID=UPI003CCC6336